MPVTSKKNQQPPIGNFEGNAYDKCSTRNYFFRPIKLDMFSNSALGRLTADILANSQRDIVTNHINEVLLYFSKKNIRSQPGHVPTVQ